jgi:predicted Abi (CAAX) family protease
LFAIALPIGFSPRFLQFQPWRTSGWHYPLLAGRLFFLPALIEELTFRVLLLPYTHAEISDQQRIIWAIVGLIRFIISPPLHAKTFYKPVDPSSPARHRWHPRLLPDWLPVDLSPESTGSSPPLG